jgi:hypothetical protein
MIETTAKRYIASLLLNFSDLCSNDAHVAGCLNFMHIPAPSGIQWNSDSVRAEIPEAYATVCNTSPYGLAALKTFEHCAAIAKTTGEAN